MKQSQQNKKMSHYSQMDATETNIIAQQCRYQHDQEIGLAISSFFKGIANMFKHDHSFQHAVTR